MYSRDLDETVGTPKVVKYTGRHSGTIAEGTETEDRSAFTGNSGAGCGPMSVWTAQMCFRLPRLRYCEVLDTYYNKMQMVRK